MTQRAIRRVCIVGGADFIGGHFADRLLAGGPTEKLMGYCNFSSGRQQHRAAHEVDPRLTAVKSACGTRPPGCRHGRAWHGGLPRVESRHRPHHD